MRSRRHRGVAGAYGIQAAAQAYFFAGEKAKAREYGQKALDLTEDPRRRSAMEQALRGMEG